MVLGPPGRLGCWKKNLKQPLRWQKSALKVIFMYQWLNSEISYINVSLEWKSGPPALPGPEWISPFSLFPHNLSLQF